MLESTVGAALGHGAAAVRLRRSGLRSRLRVRRRRPSARDGRRSARRARRRAARSASSSRRAASAEPARAVGLEQRDELGRRGPAVGALATAVDSRTAADARAVERRERGGRPGRRGTPGRRSSRPRSSRRPGPGRRPCRRSCTRSRAAPMPSTTASAPLLRTAKRIPARPTRWSRPPVAPYRHGVAGDRLADAARRARSGSGDDRDRPPDRPLPT